MPVEVIFAAILAILGGILILYKPYFGLIFFTSLILLRPADLWPALAPFHITRLIAVITLFVMFFKKAGQKESISKNCPQMRLLTILIFVMLLSVVTSIWGANSLEHFLGFLAVYIAFLLIINLIDSFDRFKVIVWIMVLSGLVLGIASVMDYLAGNYRANAIVGGMFSNSNDLALCFLMLMPFASFLFLRAKSMAGKVSSGACLAIFLLGFIFTYSRGGALGLFGVLVFLFLRSKSKIKAGIGFAIFILLFLSFAPPAYVERIKTIPVSHQDDPNTISRLDAWKAGISMMTKRPLGVGVGNFGEGFVIYRPPGAIDFPGMRRAAHNSFIQIGAETGIAGLVIFLLLIMAALKSLNQTKNKLIRARSEEARDIAYLADATLVSMAGFIICSLFLSQAYNWIFYYLIGFSIVLSEFIKKKEYEKAS